MANPPLDARPDPQQVRDETLREVLRGLRSENDSVQLRAIIASVEALLGSSAPSSECQHGRKHGECRLPNCPHWGLDGLASSAPEPTKEQDAEKVWCSCGDEADGHDGQCATCRMLILKGYKKPISPQGMAAPSTDAKEK